MHEICFLGGYSTKWYDHMECIDGSLKWGKISFTIHQE